MNGIVSTTLRDYQNMRNGITTVAIKQYRGTSSEEYANQHQNNDTAGHSGPDTYLIKGIHPLNQKEGSNQLLSVTMHRNLENGYQMEMCSPEVRSVKAVSNTINPIRFQGTSLRSPEWKTSSSQCKLEVSGTTSSISNGAPLQNSTANERRREAHWGLPAGSQPRNFPLGNYRPKTPDSSPSRRALQTQSTDAIKVYATKFSSTQLKKPSDGRNEVVVCSAKSPNELWVQYFCYREKLEEVMRNVKVSFPNSDPLINPVEGLPCVAVFPEDRGWYRAQIVKVLPDGIRIHYVDFGNTISMPNTPEHLRMMERHISEPPFYATKVKLANVLPLNGTSWEPDNRLKFKELVEDRPFLMELVQMDAGVMCIQLKDKNGLDVITHLLQKDLVKKATVEISDELDRIPSVVEIPAKSSAQHLSVQKPPIDGQLLNENVATQSNDVPLITSRMNVFKKLVRASASNCEAKSKMASSVMAFVTPKDEVVPEKTNALLEQPINNVFPMVEGETSSSDAADVPKKDEGTSNDNTSSDFFYSDGPFLDLPENGSFQALIIKVQDPRHIYLRVTSEEISAKLAHLEV